MDQKIKTVLLDMDGVLVDFIGGLARLLGVHPSKFKDGKSLQEATGMTPAEIWGKVDEDGVRFWSGLQRTPWAFELWQGLRREMGLVGGRVLICTSPSYDASCAYGKKIWLERRLGRDFRDYILTPRKTSLAFSGVLLIDDFKRDVHEFQERGGAGIFFRNEYNVPEVVDGWKETARVIQAVKEML